MSNSTGFYPRIQVDMAASGAVGQAGGVLLTETIAATGLGSAMSAALSSWRKPLAVHDPASYRSWIANRRRLEQIVAQIEQTSADAGELILRQTAPAEPPRSAKH